MKDKYSARFDKKRKPVTKVYVLMEREIGVHGVFSSQKKTNEARDWLIEHDYICNLYPNDVYIDIFELNGEWIETLTIQN